MPFFKLSHTYPVHASTVLTASEVLCFPPETSFLPFGTLFVFCFASFFFNNRICCSKPETSPRKFPACKRGAHPCTIFSFPWNSQRRSKAVIVIALHTRRRVATTPFLCVEGQDCDGHYLELTGVVTSSTPEQLAITSLLILEGKHRSRERREYSLC